jgi:hypothetical protein
MGAVVSLHEGAQSHVHNQVLFATQRFSLFGLVCSKLVTFAESVDLCWQALPPLSFSNVTTLQICMFANNLD